MIITPRGRCWVWRKKYMKEPFSTLPFFVVNVQMGFGFQNWIFNGKKCLWLAVKRIELLKQSIVKITYWQLGEKWKYSCTNNKIKYTHSFPFEHHSWPQKLQLYPSGIYHSWMVMFKSYWKLVMIFALPILFISYEVSGNVWIYSF